MRELKKSVAKTYVRLLNEACARAAKTGENQWISVPKGRWQEMNHALGEVFTEPSGHRLWLRKYVKCDTGLRIEVLESYAEKLKR